MASDFINANVQEWRRKALEGTLSEEDCRAAIAAMRGERVAASSVSAASKERKAVATAKKAPVNAQGLLDELDNF